MTGRQKGEGAKRWRWWEGCWRAGRRLSGNRCASGEEGAAMVEFAVASTVLLMTMIGIMQTSIMLYTFHLISEAAREGTRYAMVRGNTCAVSGSSCTATVAQIQSYVQNLGLPGIDPSKMTVTPTYSAYPAGGSCTPNANCANPGDLVTVKVVYAYELNIPFVPSNSLNMTSTSAMVISQ